MPIGTEKFEYQPDGSIRKVINDQDQKRPTVTPRTVVFQFLIHIVIVAVSFGLLYLTALLANPDGNSIIAIVIVIFVLMFIAQIAVGVKYYKKYFSTTSSLTWFFDQFNLKKEKREKAKLEKKKKAKTQVFGSEEPAVKAEHIEAEIDAGIAETAKKRKNEKFEECRKQISEIIKNGSKHYENLIDECSKENTRITNFNHRIIALTVGAIVIFGLVSGFFYMLHPENDNINVANIAISFSSALVTILTNGYFYKINAARQEANHISESYYSHLMQQLDLHEEHILICDSYKSIEAILLERAEQLAQNPKAHVEFFKTGKGKKVASDD